MKYLLMHTNQYGERFYFQNLGAMWPHNPSRRLIERTTPIRDEARQFDSEEQANETLCTAGNPSNWEILPA